MGFSKLLDSASNHPNPEASCRQFPCLGSGGVNLEWTRPVPRGEQDLYAVSYSAAIKADGKRRYSGPIQSQPRGFAQINSEPVAPSLIATGHFR